MFFVLYYIYGISGLSLLTDSMIGVPTLLWSDWNSILAACHMVLRHNHDDELSGKHSFRYGSSTTNTVSMLIIIIIHCKNLGVISLQNGCTSPR